MEIFVAWYYGDPEYQNIDLNCSIVISITSVPKKWNVGKWKFQPRKLIVNCGSPARRSKLGFSVPRKALLTQLKLINNFTGEVFVCFPDIPLPRKIKTVGDAKQTLELNIKLADSYLKEFRQIVKGGDNIHPMAIIHGYNEKSLMLVAEKLKEIGYEYFALGSQEAKSRIDRKSIAEFIDTLVGNVNYLHILGVTSVDMQSDYLSFLKVQSADSSTPIKEAFTNGIYFSHPIRRFKICTEKLNINWIRNWGYANLVCNPFRIKTCEKLCKKVENGLKHRIISFNELPKCDCPVCKKFGEKEALFGIGKKVYNNRRALHNYYHIKKEFEPILDNPFLKRKECSCYIR